MTLLVMTMTTLTLRRTLALIRFALRRTEDANQLLRRQLLFELRVVIALHLQRQFIALQRIFHTLQSLSIVERTHARLFALTLTRRFTHAVSTTNAHERVLIRRIQRHEPLLRAVVELQFVGQAIGHLRTFFHTVGRFGSLRTVLRVKRGAAHAGSTHKDSYFFHNRINI